MTTKHKTNCKGIVNIKQMYPNCEIKVLQLKDIKINVSYHCNIYSKISLFLENKFLFTLLPK